MFINENIISMGLVLCLMAVARESVAGSSSIADLIPEEIAGWRIGEADQQFSGKEIFTYIDGAGEVYLAYNFQQVLVRRFSKPGQPDIVVELFDMGSAKDAYGVFSHDRESETADIGEGCERRGGLLSFWKGKYLVTIFAEAEGSDAQNAVNVLAKSMADRIPKGEGKPEILNYLPQKGLMSNSIRYFHRHSILNYHYFLAEDNVLFLNDETECALAQYEQDGDKNLFLLIRYQTAGDREIAEQSFVENYLPEAKNSRSARIENHRWTAFRGRDRYLGIVFDALAEETAVSLLTNCKILMTPE